MTDNNHPDNLDFNNSNYIIAKADTGASNHYWRQKDTEILNKLTKKPGPSVQLPNSEIIHTTATGVVPLSKALSEAARNTMILPKLTSASLISLGQLCDDNCDIILNKNEMCAYKNNKIILKGYRNHKDGLWDIPIKKTSITSKCCFAPITHPGLYGTKSNITNSHNMPKTNHDNIKCIKPVKHKKVADIINWDDELRHQQDWNKKYIENQKANVIIRKKQTRVELAQYLHAACYSPVTSTFVKAIKKGFFKTWPGLTPELVK